MAGIIKVGQPLTRPTSAASPAYQFDDMGDAYLSRVKAEAAKIIADARAEAIQIKAQAGEAGKEAALKAVEASVRTRLDQQLQSLLAALKQAIAGIAQSRQAWERHWESHALQVSTAIAARVIRREVRSSPQISQTLIREALQLASGCGQIVVRLAPADHAALAGQTAQITKELNLVAPAQFVADPTISPGGCRVETQFGSIDNQIETQLARLTEELLA
ncbi:MAG: FliH/SctL family protein [Pirellulaceae bacterium]|nr:FliH/SctL family protein [Pirellulaceae bacterium]